MTFDEMWDHQQYTDDPDDKEFAKHFYFQGAKPYIEEITQLRTTITELNARIDDRNAALLSKTVELSECQKQRDELLAEINNKSQQIAHLTDEEIAEVINQGNTVDGNRYLPFAYARAIEVAILNKLEPVCEIIRDKGDIGTMRTVVWKDGILPEVL